MSKKIDFLSEIQNLEKVMPTIAKRTIEEYLGNDGKVQIDINLYEGAELFNRFSFGKQRDLNNEIYNLIDAKLYTIPLKYSIKICFHGHISNQEIQEDIRSMIQEHYMYVFLDKKEDLRMNLFKTIGMTVFGIVLLAIYFTIEITSSNPIFMEFLSIAGWFAVWEAVDTWILQRKTIKMNYLIAGKAVLSEITFLK